MKPKKFESAIFWGLGIRSAEPECISEGHLGESVISPKPHEDSSTEATNKFAEEIELRKESNLKENDINALTFGGVRG
ncbi:MAG: hypothetical protein LBS83_03290 [Holosporales bacterium]|nr:hypothetical protein [Holosporales bacterium]